MSEPTYRIEVENTPGDVYEWYVRIFRLSDDDFPAHTFHSGEMHDAERRARAWVAAQDEKRVTRELLVGDDGQDVPGYSVKA